MASAVLHAHFYFRRWFDQVRARSGRRSEVFRGSLPGTQTRAKMAFLEGDELEKALLGFVKAQDSALDPAAVRSLNMHSQAPVSYSVRASTYSSVNLSAPRCVLRAHRQFSRKGRKERRLVSACWPLQSAPAHSSHAQHGRKRERVVHQTSEMLQRSCSLNFWKSHLQVASDESFAKGIGGSKADHIAEKIMYSPVHHPPFML